MPPLSAQQQILRNGGDQLSRNMRRAIIGAVESGGKKGATRQLLALAAAFANNLGEPGEVLKAHEDTAAFVREETLRGYDETVGAHKHLRYRAGDNRLSGDLRPALENRSMAVGTEDGVDFVDTRALNEQAAHWRRLNFGAYGTEVTTREAQKYRFIFDKTALFQFGLTGGPSAAFFLPEGFFSGADGARVGRNLGRVGQDKFQPISSKRVIEPTRGIKGFNYLDYGVHAIAEALPIAYTDLLDRWFKRGVISAKDYGVIEVDAVNPNRLRNVPPIVVEKK